MSTLPITPTGPSRLDLILLIIETALKGLGGVPAIGAGAAIASAFLQIFQAGLTAYEMEAGKPIDLTLIQQEAPVVVPPAPPAV